MKKAFYFVLVISIVACSKGLKPSNTVKNESIKMDKGTTSSKKQEWDTAYPVAGRDDFMVLSPHKEKLSDTTKKGN